MQPGTESTESSENRGRDWCYAARPRQRTLIQRVFPEPWLPLAVIISVLVFSLGTRSAAAQSACDALEGEKKEIAQSVLDSQYCYDCCDETIADCLESAPECTLPERLAYYVCRLAANGEDEESIVRALEKRALSMMRPGKVYDIELLDNMMAGCENGQVTVVVYLCARCPYCAKLIPELHRAVVTGGLSGKIKLYVRIFPIKTHEHGTEANLALGAAAEMGFLWDYLLYVYVHFNQFKPEVLGEWAVAVGLNESRFNELRDSKLVRESVTNSKKEGLRNNVTSTPTIFINGRMFMGEPDIETVVDLLEEELEATQGE